jgi:uncharacterized protein (DUF2235 family)
MNSLTSGSNLLTDGSRTSINSSGILTDSSKALTNEPNLLSKNAGETAKLNLCPGSRRKCLWFPVSHPGTDPGPKYLKEDLVLVLVP